MPKTTKVMLEEENKGLRSEITRLVNKQLLLQREVKMLTDFTKNLNNLHSTMTVAGERMCDVIAHVITDLKVIRENRI